MNNSGDKIRTRTHNIAIIKLSSLGDIIHTLPALQLLRQHFPESNISWLVEPSGACLLENVTGIDEIISINLKISGVTKKIIELKRILKTYRKHFDLIIDFQGLLKSALLSRLLKGQVIGFHRNNLKEPCARLFYKKNAAYFDENQHVIRKNIHLLKSLGISGSDIQYPQKKQLNSPRLANFLKTRSLTPKKFIILNIGGGWPTKLLDPDQYIEIATRLKKKYPVVILWGNQAEQKLAERVSKSSQTHLSIFLNFDELFEMIRKSALIITADTLAMHVADMMKIPSVGIFGPTSPDRNGSLLENSRAITHQSECGFCYKKKCDKMICLDAVRSQEILHWVNQIYEKYN